MRNLLTVFFALCTLNTITVSARPAFDYSALRDGTFEQKTVSGVRSLSDGERYTTMSDGRVLCFSYRTGEPAGVLFDASAAEPRIEFTDYVLSADERRLLLTTDVEPIYRHSFTAEYWIYDRQDGSLRRLSQGGPQQQAADRWTIGWEDVLVQQGYIVACVDGRGTGFRGEEFKKCTYGELGKYETVDQIEAARYLASLPYVDPDRIGIYGWSYGGFMALNCILKGNDVFRAAIAVAPVTSWRFYDTIYTEIYNGLPQDNPSGYDDNSPIHFADRLKGKLLIAHGTGDDNVHIQNTYEMITKLVEYDKPFELYVYPDRNHGMGPSRHHLMERCIEFVQRNL